MLAETDSLRSQLVQSHDEARFDSTSFQIVAENNTKKNSNFKIESCDVTSSFLLCYKLTGLGAESLESLGVAEGLAHATGSRGSRHFKRLDHFLDVFF